eukprot:PhF_6_TR31117/c0_g1_i1/m.45542
MIEIRGRNSSSSVCVPIPIGTVTMADACRQICTVLDRSESHTIIPSAKCFHNGNPWNLEDTITLDEPNAIYTLVWPVIQATIHNRTESHFIMNMAVDVWRNGILPFLPPSNRFVSTPLVCTAMFRWTRMAVQHVVACPDRRSVFVDRDVPRLRGFSALRVLDVSGSQLTQGVLFPAVQWFPLLHTLDVSFCHNVTSLHELQHPRIETLRVNGMIHLLRRRETCLKRTLLPKIKELVVMWGTNVSEDLKLCGRSIGYTYVVNISVETLASTRILIRNVSMDSCTGITVKHRIQRETHLKPEWMQLYLEGGYDIRDEDSILDV